MVNGSFALTARFAVFSFDFFVSVSSKLKPVIIGLIVFTIIVAGSVTALSRAESL